MSLKMTLLRLTLALTVGMAILFAASAQTDYPIRSIDLRGIRVTRGFWFDRLETNRTATLRSNWGKCHETPRIANFTNAAQRTVGTFGGIPFDDSDVYKVMEGTAGRKARRSADRRLRARGRLVQVRGGPHQERLAL